MCLKLTLTTQACLLHISRAWGAGAGVTQDVARVGAGGGAFASTHLPAAVGGFARLPGWVSQLATEAEVHVRDLDLYASTGRALPSIRT